MGDLEEVTRQHVLLAVRDGDGPTFEAHIRQEIAANTDPDTAAAYLQACPPEQQWPGLERYWRRRSEGILAP